MIFKSEPTRDLQFVEFKERSNSQLFTGIFPIHLLVILEIVRDAGILCHVLPASPTRASLQRDFQFLQLSVHVVVLVLVVTWLGYIGLHGDLNREF